MEVFERSTCNVSGSLSRGRRCANLSVSLGIFYGYPSEQVAALRVLLALGIPSQITARSGEMELTTTSKSGL